MHERIVTTEAKAKELGPEIEKLITIARGGSLASRRHLAEHLPQAAAKKLSTVLSPRFEKRSGGYTRIIKLGPRKSDAAREALIEFVS